MYEKGAKDNRGIPSKCLMTIIIVPAIFIAFFIASWFIRIVLENAATWTEFSAFIVPTLGLAGGFYMGKAVYEWRGKVVWGILAGLVLFTISVFYDRILPFSQELVGIALGAIFSICFSLLIVAIPVYLLYCQLRIHKGKQQ